MKDILRYFQNQCLRSNDTVHEVTKLAPNIYTKKSLVAIAAAYLPTISLVNKPKLKIHAYFYSN